MLLAVCICCLRVLSGIAVLDTSLRISHGAAMTVHVLDFQCGYFVATGLCIMPVYDAYVQK